MKFSSKNQFRTNEIMKGIKRHFLFLKDPTMLRTFDVIKNTIKIKIPIVVCRMQYALQYADAVSFL